MFRHLALSHQHVFRGLINLLFL